MVQGKTDGGSQHATHSNCPAWAPQFSVSMPQIASCLVK
jgi:hypothetical protein